MSEAKNKLIDLLCSCGYREDHIRQILANETCYGIDYGIRGWRDVSLDAAKERMAKDALLIAVLEAVERESPGVSIPEEDTPAF